MKNMFDSNILVKVGEFNHLKDLVENGTLYMKPLREFRKNSTPGVGDPEEGNLFSCQNMEVWKEDKKLGTADIETHNGIDYPVFCCFNLVVKKINDDFYWGKIPVRLLKDFSKDKQNPAIVFLQQKELLAKLSQTRYANNFICGPVQYTDAFVRMWTYFQKRKEFSYQQEYRVVLKEKCFEHYKKVNLNAFKFYIDIFELPENIVDMYIVLHKKSVTNAEIAISFNAYPERMLEAQIVADLMKRYQKLTAKEM